MEVGVGVRWLSEPAPLTRLGLELQIQRRFRVSFGATALLPQRLRYEEGYATLQLAGAYARGCARALASATLALWWCIEPTLGVLSGTGHGYQETYERRLLWAAVSAGARIEGSLSTPAFWSLSALGTMPLSQRGFAVRSGQEQHELFAVSRLGLLASFGLGVWF